MLTLFSQIEGEKKIVRSFTGRDEMQFREVHRPRVWVLRRVAFRQRGKCKQRELNRSSRLRGRWTVKFEMLPSLSDDH